MKLYNMVTVYNSEALIVVRYVYIWSEIKFNGLYTDVFLGTFSK
jgi:hypothetical protein